MLGRARSWAKELLKGLGTEVTDTYGSSWQHADSSYDGVKTGRKAQKRSAPTESAENNDHPRL